MQLAFLLSSLKSYFCMSDEIAKSESVKQKHAHSNKVEAFSTRQVIVLVLHQATVTLLFSFTAVFSVKALITLQKRIPLHHPLHRQT